MGAALFAHGVLLSVLAGCPHAEARRETPPTAAPAPGGAQTDVTAENYVSPPMPKGFVTLKDAYGGSHRLEVEIANTGPTRERGLMWREELPAGKGMLFVFPVAQIQEFWMKNTLVPLDMIFIDEDRRVVGVVEQAVPKTLTPRGVPRASVYVLEVPGGWAQKIGVKVGTQVEMESVPLPGAD